MNTEQIKHDVWVDTKQVSEWFNIKPGTLKKQRQRGVGLPYHKFGTLVRYNTLEVQQYLDERKKND
tara:strand:+ start:319 stop:516 length:198 start_codon:yes stop_codon:yes gene_type:complete